MSNGYLMDGYHGEAAAYAPSSARMAFIRRTYAHLAGAVAAFVALQFLIFKSGAVDNVMRAYFQGAQNGGWIAVLVLFIGAGYAARWLARSRSSPATQYMGLALYVLAEVLIFVPFLWKAETFFPNQHIIAQAGIMTLVVFGGLTASVFLTKKDFSFLGTGITVVSFMALGLIVCAIAFGFTSMLGIWFSLVMIGLAAACILYDTSNVLHHYGTDEHVGAALELFASLALMFWYVLRLIMATANSGD